jgi:hypothetical protein
MPYLEAGANAFWVLRNYRFWQDAKGSGFVLNFRADYVLMDHLSLSTGLRRVRLVADRDGIEGGGLGTMYNENAPIVSEITSEYSGVEIGASLEF